MAGDVSGLDAFLDLLPDLNAAELLAIAAAHRDQDAAALVHARREAELQVGRLGRTSELDRVVGRISQWAISVAPASGVFAGPVGPARDPLLAEARAQAGSALVNAAIAVAFSPHLDRSTTDVLLAAWQAGRPIRDRGRGRPSSRDIYRR
jgi:hypothetical protein